MTNSSATAPTAGDGLEHLLSPRSVAVIGATTDPTRIGGRSISYMLSQGFKGRIFPVNPNRREIQGLPAFASVTDLPEPPDVGIVIVPARAAVQAVKDLAAQGTSTAIVFSSGFAETGPEGVAMQAEMLTAARRSGMRILGPNTLGLFDARSGFYGTFASMFEGGFPKRGSIGIASQSGAYGGHLFSIARARGLGLAACVLTGNEADITIGDAIARMVKDPDTDVIAAYAEGINRPDTLLAALEAARLAHKPVVMMKVGRSTIGGKAAQSHTASMTGNDAVFDAVLAEFGVVRARSTEEMLDIAHLATRRIYPAGNTLGVLSISGGAGVLISDVAEDLAIAMPPMPEAAQARLKAFVPFCSAVNPVDCTAQVMNDISLVGKFAEAVVEHGGYSSVLSFFTYTGGTSIVGPKLLEQLGAVRASHPDRLFVLSIVASAERVAEFEAAGFAVFEDPTRAVIAIAAMGRFGDAFARPQRALPAAIELFQLPASTPSEAVAKRLLATAGIASAPERAVADIDAAVAAAEAIGFPVVLKVLSADILHKSEIGGVLLDVADAAAVRAGFKVLIERARMHAPDARIEGVLVAKQLKAGVECLLGINRDPVFGPIAVFGLGGVFVEVLKDVVLRRCPFDEAEAEAMIRSIKGAPLLCGARGKPAADIKALAHMLSRLSVVGHQAESRLASIDLNPVLVMPAGQGAYAVDAVIEIGDHP